MHARVTTIQMDAARIDEAVRQLESEDIPRFREIDGFKGVTLLVDRESGKAVGTSYWESREQMEASEQAVEDSRRRAADAGGATSAPQVERFEVAVDTQV
jgi:heme-degrading monooxygenase HmoA